MLRCAARGRHAPLGLCGEAERGELAGCGLALQLHVRVARSCILGSGRLNAAAAQPPEHSACQKQRQRGARHHSALALRLQRIEALLEHLRRKAAFPLCATARCRLGRGPGCAGSARGRAARFAEGGASAHVARGAKCRPAEAAQAGEPGAAQGQLRSLWRCIAGTHPAELATAVPAGGAAAAAAVRCGAIATRSAVRAQARLVGGGARHAAQHAVLEAAERGTGGSDGRRRLRRTPPR